MSTVRDFIGYKRMVIIHIIMLSDMILESTKLFTFGLEGGTNHELR